jgi:hypothetical protein
MKNIFVNDVFTDVHASESRNLCWCFSIGLARKTRSMMNSTQSLRRCRSQWPRGLKHELSSPSRTLGSWVRIPLKVWMFICVCISSGLATGWYPIQGVIPTALGLRNWSETKRFTDALCSKLGATGKRVREPPSSYSLEPRASYNFKWWGDEFQVSEFRSFQHNGLDEWLSRGRRKSSFSCGGVRLSPLGTSATVWLIEPARMVDDDECGELGGMRIGRGNRSTRRKPAPVPLCPPQIPHDLTWSQTWAAVVGSRRLTAWAMARPNGQNLHNFKSYCHILSLILFV